MFRGKDVLFVLFINVKDEEKDQRHIGGGFFFFLLDVGWSRIERVEGVAV